LTIVCLKKAISLGFGDLKQIFLYFVISGFLHELINPPPRSGEVIIGMHFISLSVCPSHKIKQLVFSHSWPVVVYNFDQVQLTRQVREKQNVYTKTTSEDIVVLWTALFW